MCQSSSEFMYRILSLERSLYPTCQLMRYYIYDTAQTTILANRQTGIAVHAGSIIDSKAHLLFRGFINNNQ